MALESSPAFQLYVKEWRSSRSVMRMSFAQRGMYLEMMLEQWENLSLPDNPSDVAEIIGGTVQEWTKAWPVLRRNFSESEAGRIVNRRLERERDKQRARSGRASAKGAKGASVRWRKDESSEPEPAAQDSQPMPVPFQQSDTGIPENSFAFAIPISIATPVSDSGKFPIRATPYLKPSYEDVVTKRGGDLVRRYGELFTEHRFGARYRQRENLDWLEACELCRIWDDQRLEKLAVLVLTTDDPFISSTDRGFKIFSMKASWADARLSEWEKENGVKAS